MNCESRKDDILLLAAGALDEPAARLLRAHLDSGCETCCQLFEETEADLAHLVLTLPPLALPRRLKTELHWRNSIEKPERGMSKDRPGRYVRTAIWSAVAGAAATTLFVHFMIGQPLREEVAELREVHQQQHAQINELSGQVQFATHRLSELQTPHLRYVALEAGDGHTGGVSYILLDSLNEQLHCYFFDLPAPRGTLAVWLDVLGESVLVGQVEPNASGQSALLISIDVGLFPVSLTVTEESLTSPTTPSGVVVFHGELDE